MDGLSDDNLYDFVTVVLRDIAKSFGLIWTNKAVRNEQFKINIQKITPYEQFILTALGYTGDNHQAYLNAIKGQLTIGEYSNRWNLYAPTTWDTDRSLNYFTPTAGKKITQLLSYDFGRGSVIRDIACKDTYEMFRTLLQWKGDIAVGASGENVSDDVSVSTEDVIPYKGQITIAAENASFAAAPAASQPMETTPSYEYPEDNTFLETLYIYHPNYRIDSAGNWDIDSEGWTVALRLKDGTWDIVSSSYVYPYLFQVSTSDFTLHHDAEDYARTCDGYLRCRVTLARSEPYFDTMRLRSRSYYYVLDYLPQRVKVMKSSELPYEDPDDYYRDVEIGLKDIEGVKKIVVAQLDEGNNVPYLYEVPDFRKGTFTATVDREYSSTFTITAYNDNGSTVSYPYVMPPLTPIDELEYNFTIKDNKIQVTSNSGRYEINELLNRSCSFRRIDVSGAYTDRFTTIVLSDGNGCFDISGLKEGLYVMTVSDVAGGSHKFMFLIKSGIR